MTPARSTDDLLLLDRVVIEAAVTDLRHAVEAPGDPAVFLEEAGEAAASLGGMFDAIGPSNAVFTFDRRDAGEALNAAIHIQEASLHHGDLGGTPCAIGVALGSTRTAGASNGGVVGHGAATARRLADAANPGAVFVDIDTIAAANLLDVSSRVGRLHRRTHHDYLGPVGHLPSNLPSHTITFVELVWDERPHGIRADALGDLSWWQTASPRSADPWHNGVVRSWNADRKHGFIVSDAEFFYFDDRFMVGTDPPPVGSQVWFHARPPLIAGKSRLAVTVLEHDGTLTTDDDGPAAEVADRAGNRAILLVTGAAANGGSRRVAEGPDAQPRLV